MALNKYFRIPFALTGDKTPIPETTQPSGDVSYEEGYGLDYQLDPGIEPSAKNIERDKYNAVLNDITVALQEYQQLGVPYFITTAQNGGVPFPYPINAIVRYDNGTYEGLYRSRINNNTSLPTVTANWFEIVVSGSSALVIPSATFEGSVSNGEWVYYDAANSRFDQALANGTNTQNVIGIADVTNSQVFIAGEITGLVSGLTTNVPYYLSTSSAGTITASLPSTNAVRVGTSRSATSFHININFAEPLATETVAGLVEIATNAEAQSFTANKIIDGAKLASAFQGANQSLAANGYQRLPGGLILQWATGANATAPALGAAVTNVSLPIAFPNAILHVVVSAKYVSGNACAIYEDATGTTLSNVRTVVANPTTGASGTYAPKVFAIGH